jgi:hypothetical protein
VKVRIRNETPDEGRTRSDLKKGRYGEIPIAGVAKIARLSKMVPEKKQEFAVSAEN